MSISLDGLSGMYSEYGDIYNSNSTSGDSLKTSMEKTDYSTSTEEELMDACKEFEAYFVEQAFKALQNMVPETDLDQNKYMQYFGDTLTQEYAASATESGDGLGLAQMLFEQMKRNYNL
jgi:peptidoglycan hydrolase FlgJ